MMMAPLSSSHGRSGQRTPYLRQTSSVCGCRCPRRCRTCPASKYDAPGVLGHHQQLQLASWSGLLSLSVHAPPCPSLARARPQVQGCLVLGQEPAFSGRWGFSWAVVRVGMGGRSRACSRPTKRFRTTSLGSRWRVSMDTVRPTNHPSIDSCPPSTHLSLGIARVQREPVPQPSNPSCSRPAEKKS